MRTAQNSMWIAVAATLVLGACSGNDTPQLMNLRQTGNGPDEFAILPPKALEMPQDLALLPEPTPGGANRTDPTPHADAVAALGGNPAALGGAPNVPAADGALVTQAARYGVSGDIRQTVAAEDLEFRRQNNGRLLERWFNVNTYYSAYRKEALDQHDELERWRGAGARTVAAPPEPDN